MTTSIPTAPTSSQRKLSSIGIQRGLADIKAGRTVSNEDAMASVRKIIDAAAGDVVLTLNARCAVISFYCLRPICGETKGVGPEMMMCPYCEGERPHNPDKCPNCGESPPPPPPKAKPKPEFVFRSTRGRHEPKA